MDKICHEGIIKNINNHIIEVSIISASACASCHTKGLCNLSEIQQKIVEVNVQNYSQFKVGEKVNIFMTQSMGTRAVLLGYFFPFIVMLLIIIILAYMKIGELIIGVTSLIFVAIYYIILYFFKEKISKEFSFSIQKIK